MVVVFLGLKRDWSLEAQNLLSSIVAGCLVFIVLSKGPAWNGLIKIQVKRLYGKGAHPRLIELHKIRVNNSGVLEESEAGEHRVNWKGIVKVESSDTHAYIYIGAVQAHVIPKATVIEGDYYSFVAHAKNGSSKNVPDCRKFESTCRNLPPTRFILKKFCEIY